MIVTRRDTEKRRFAEIMHMHHFVALVIFHYFAVNQPRSFMNVQQKIVDLERRINRLIRQHNETRKEIADLREELKELKVSAEIEEKAPRHTSKSAEIPAIVQTSPVESPETEVPQEVPVMPSPSSEDRKRNIEQFIGGKLINFIGIGILVLGVSMGIKYAIDKDLIGPLFRVLLGYGAGIGLVFLAWRLKNKYAHYSAVMLGGGVSILYFDTYAAFEFYQLIPYPFAFLIMLVITVFTVWAAVLYDLQIIGIIGLVGAYAIPILLSQDSGRMHILFTYMTIINIGILILAFRKDWRLLNHCAFTLTWLIFTGWYTFELNQGEYRTTSIVFASVFFLIFYASFLAYKLIHFEKFGVKDVILLLLNAFIFYGVGFDWVSDLEGGKGWLGLYTLAHAAVHFGVSMLIHTRKQADRNVYYLVIGLVLAFLAIAVPVQLDGNWVTLFWLFMAIALLAIGHFREVGFYRSLAYIMVSLCFFSLWNDWYETYPQSRIMQPSPEPFLLNMTFYTSILTMAGLFGMISINKLREEVESHRFRKLMTNYGIPGLLMIVSFFTFFLEIGQHFYGLYYESEQITGGEINRDYALLHMRIIWLMIYSFIFLSISSSINQYLYKSEILGKILTIAGVIVISLFCTEGLWVLSELRESYLNPGAYPLYTHNWRHIGIRYLSYAFLAPLVFVLGRQLKQTSWWPEKENYWLLGMHAIILIVLSSELSNIILIASEQAAQSLAYKVSTSLLWGAYAILLIVLGIRKQAPVFRYAAFVLIGITLIKVFFFDLSNTPTISRIMIFIGLGALLMLGAYFYQRHRDDI